MKKNLIGLIFITVFFFLINLNVVNADLSSKGENVGDSEVTSGGSWNFGKGVTGIKITIAENHRNQSGYSEKTSFYITRTQLESYSDFTIYKDWWKKTGTKQKVDSSKLYEYLNIPYSTQSGDYTNLLWFLEHYARYGLDDLNSSMYIYVEPFASKGGNLYTLREFLSSGNTESTDGVAARLLAHAAAVGKKVGAYEAIENDCDDTIKTSTSFCGVSTNSGNGYGVIEIAVSDVLTSNPPKQETPPNTTSQVVITKLDSSGNPIRNVRFFLCEALSDGKASNVCQLPVTTDENGIAIFDLTNAKLVNNGSGIAYRLIEEIPAGYDATKAIMYFSDYGGGATPSTYGSSEHYIDTNGNPTWGVRKIDENRIFTIINEKSCISEFNALSDKKNLSERIRLYGTYISEDNHKLNNLLNLNIEDAETACSYKTCNQSLNSGCLAVSNQSTSDGDFSCFDFSINDKTYCYSNFNLMNLFSNSPSSGSYQFGKDKILFAGQFITNLKYAALLNLDIKCYSVEDKGDTLPLKNNDEEISYSDFISEIYFKGLKLGYTNNFNEQIKLKNKSNVYGGYIYYSKNISYFTFPKVYSHVMTGRIKYNIVSNFEKYRDLGYGIVSDLDDFAENNITYSVKFGDAIVKNDQYNNIPSDKKYINTNSCSYILKNNIIENPNSPGGNEKLNLEFRVIDATTSDSVENYAKKLFPGMFGNGRKIGSNWCIDKNSYCASNNINLIKNINMEVITNNPNSYGRIPSTGEVKTAKYVIELDSSTINKIRTYNDTYAYDEYDLKYNEESGVYESTFLNDTTIWNSTNLIR